MKNLTTLDLHAISGGNAEQLTVTQKISLAGISDKCINILLNNVVNSNIHTEEEQNKMYIQILGHCTLSEINLLDERSDAAPFLTVNYK